MSYLKYSPNQGFCNQVKGQMNQATGLGPSSATEKRIHAEAGRYITIMKRFVITLMKSAVKA